MSTYYIRNETILQHMLEEVRGIQKKGGSPKVSVSDQKATRSFKQNRLMHTWFQDISKSTGNDLVLEAGRCKMTYFVPVMKSSEREHARELCDIIDTIIYQKGYEDTVKFLGTGALESTRSLTVKEFSQAMFSMQDGENEHNLTDPEVYDLVGI